MTVIAMQVYEAPLRDMRFVLHELFSQDEFGRSAALAEFTPEVLDAVLEEAAQFMQNVLLPLNAPGDLEGCVIENGAVRTPKGFKEAYRLFCESGWSVLAEDPKWGGQGLPECVYKLVAEMICSANLSFSLYPGLTHGACVAIEQHASDELKQRFLPKMVSGEWSGTMCLTEPHCGTDLGLLRTRAEPNGDGTYRISGSKIFISAGDHDLTSNIIHLVLARLPDAPAGVKAISVFLVPKYLPDTNGNLGERNHVSVASLEHKIGLKASATCQLQFDGSIGWLIGEPHRGLAAMFSMMNTERLAVGIQGLGINEVAYQSAVAYAKERLQGRSLSGTKQPHSPADPIIVHPDVRRMLLTMRTYAEGNRAIAQWIARALDTAKHADDPATHERAADFVALLTPVVAKALFTDLASEAANLCVQVHGGHGYIREHGVEQFVRDVRITQIYEGTNGIQALDLIGRKLPHRMGRMLRPFFHAVSAQLEQSEGVSSKLLSIWRNGLQQAFGALQLATGLIAQKGLSDPEEAAAVASDYLRMLGIVAIGHCFFKAASIATQRLASGTGEAGFYQAKLATAGFFFDKILPQVSASLLTIKSGKRSIMGLAAEAF